MSRPWDSWPTRQARVLRGGTMRRISVRVSPDGWAYPATALRTLARHTPRDATASVVNSGDLQVSWHTTQRHGRVTLPHCRLTCGVGHEVSRYGATCEWGHEPFQPAPSTPPGEIDLGVGDPVEETYRHPYTSEWMRGAVCWRRGRAYRLDDLVDAVCEMREGERARVSGRRTGELVISQSGVTWTIRPVDVSEAL